MADDEQRIRQLAYRIWESEGRPDGQEQRHWEMARKIVAAERESGRDAHSDVAIAPDDSDHSGSRRTEDSVSTPNVTDTPGRSATTRSRTGAAKAGAKTAKAAKTKTSTAKAKAGSKTASEKSTRSRSTTTGKHEKTEEKTEEKTKASDTPRKPRK